MGSSLGTLADGVRCPRRVIHGHGDAMVLEVLQEASGTVLDVIDGWGQVGFSPMVLDEVFPRRGRRELFQEGGH